MSGGSLDYVQHRIDEAAQTILRRSGGRSDGVLLRAFSKFLLEVGQACRDIEWDFSGDSSLSTEQIDRIKRLMGPTGIIEQALQEAKEAHHNLGVVIRDLGFIIQEDMATPKP